MSYGYIYVIENDINDKLYIGQTIDLNRRRRAHFARTSSCGNMPIKRAMEKYGRQHFDFVLLETCFSSEELDRREIYWIRELDAISPNGYNLAAGGNSDIPSAETRRRMSVWQKDKKILSNEHRKKISNSLKGISKSDETRKRMSLNSSYRNKTHCPQGHSLDVVNTYYCTRKDGRAYRRCYTCLKESNRRSYYKRKLKEIKEG